ncbi:hypothetical protein [Parapedobacter tibetensis]|uniref:hypothetical protein n=1 Tax=Parapedobacter tibetensis TaxID=2972951 RepID=UPI00214DC9D2|nr:hypothetical protein [Parapedobacter tibetensis]
MEQELTKNGNARIDYDLKGRIRQIGDKRFDYDLNGYIRSIGGVPIEKVARKTLQRYRMIQRMNGGKKLGNTT